MSDRNKVRLPEGYASGEYAVGTACFTVVDTGRKKVLGDGTEDRKISVRMYYPVSREAAAGKTYAPIFSDTKAAAGGAFPASRLLPQHVL